MLAHFYLVVYILDMTPCELFLLTKNGSWNLKQLVLITFLLLEYINLYICVYIYIYILTRFRMGESKKAPSTSFYLYLFETEKLVPKIFLHCCKI